MKIVKIISILISIIVVAAVLLPVVSGADKAKEDSKSPANENILERFKRTKISKNLAAQNELSPLVKESQVFSSYLNPKPKPAPVATQQDTIPNNVTPGVAMPVQPPIPTSGQFKLIATCVNESNPQLSLALLDLPGEGTKWVRQSNKVGYLIIKEIKTGQVIASNGQQTINIMIEPKPVMPSLVKGQSTAAFTTPVSSASAMISPTTSINTAASASATSRLGSTRTPPTQPTPVKTVQPDTQSRALTAEEEAFVQKFMNDLDVINSTAGTEQERFQKSDELLNKLFTDANGLTSVEYGDDQANDDNNNAESNVTDPNLANRRIPRQRPVPTPK